jgi:DNA polymerase alpha subunit A
MKALGKSDSDLVNNFIPYVICKTQAEEKKKLSIGDMAYSPDEYLDKRKGLEIDIEWYITQQILPPITRLIEHIEGIEVEFVAQCLGVDGKKYRYATGGSANEAADLGVANPIMKSETTDKLQDRAIASLKIVCPHCDHSFDFPEIYHKSQKSGDLIASNICTNCKVQIPEQYIKNRVQLFLK